MNRFALTVCVTIVMLAGCSGSQPLISAPGAMPQSNASTGYKSLYSFGAGSDGQQPKAALIDVNGVFYGTTYGGGLYGDGTVFSVSTTGTERVLYSFQGDRDGANTLPGGTYGKGTLFSMSLTGSEKVLHSFGYGPDGSEPDGGLIEVHGTLYGTTSAGRKYGDGTVFALTP